MSQFETFSYLEPSSDHDRRMNFQNLKARSIENPAQSFLRVKTNVGRISGVPPFFEKSGSLFTTGMELSHSTEITTSLHQRQQLCPCLVWKVEMLNDLSADNKIIFSCEDRFVGSIIRIINFTGIAIALDHFLQCGSWA